jgi:hypothetical protein
VDQIIERKLKALPDTAEKADMIIELKDKNEYVVQFDPADVSSWRTYQLTLPQAKAASKRNRGLEDIISNLVDQWSAPEASGHRRRASRHLPELGAPVPDSPPLNLSTGMSLGDLHRLHAINDAQEANRGTAAAELRRLRETMLREQVAAVQALELRMAQPRAVQGEPRHEPETWRREGPARPQEPLQQRQERPGTSSPRPVPNRQRSQILAERQARGRGRVGSREAPVLVGSDSE